MAYFGRAVEAELDGVDGKNRADIAQKRRRVLDRFLSEGEPSKGTFADPAQMFGG